MLKPPKTITRKQLKRDPLMEAIYRTRQWWLAHRGPASRYGWIALLVIVMTLLITRWRGAENAKAAVAVGVSFVEYSRGNYNTVIAQLGPHVEEYRGFKSFAHGLYLLARSELAAGDSAQAEEHYRLYLEEYGRDPLEKAGALGGLGVIVEGRGGHKEAAELFRQASSTAPTVSLRHRYAIYAGRNLMLAQLPAEALDVLRPMLNDEDVDFQTRREIMSLVANAEALLEAAPDA